MCQFLLLLLLPLSCLDSGVLAESFVVRANNRLGVDLYQDLVQRIGTSAVKPRDPNADNLFLSAFGAFSSVAMLLQGAKDDTAEELKNVLRSQDFTVEPELQALRLVALQSLNGAQPTGSRSTAENSKRPSNYEFHMASRMYVSSDYPVKQRLATRLRRYFATGVENRNFSADPEKARLIINDWISGRTGGKIDNMFEKGSVTANTALLLANAIYFSARWQEAFPVSRTRPGLFQALDRTNVRADFMNGFFYAKRMDGRRISRYRGTEFEVLELPFSAHKLNMMLLVPPVGANFTEFERGITERLLFRLNLVMYAAKTRRLHVRVPRFRVEQTLDLKPSLQRLGLEAGFSELFADFTGVSRQARFGRGRNLALSDIKQKSVIELTEKGTVAQGVEGVLFSDPLGEEKPKPLEEFHADRPFVYYISHRDTGTILFIGRFVKPARPATGREPGGNLVSSDTPMQWWPLILLLLGLMIAPVAATAKVSGRSFF